MRKLPLDIRNALAKAQMDLEWAVRVCYESATPEVLDVPALVRGIEAAVRAGQGAAIDSKAASTVGDAAK